MDSNGNNLRRLPPPGKRSPRDMEGIADGSPFSGVNHAERMAGNMASVELGPPPYLRWAENIQSLITDDEGKELFTRYLAQPDSRPVYMECLSFMYAVKGFRQMFQSEDTDDPVRVFKAICRKFFSAISPFLHDRTKAELESKFKLARKNTLDHVDCRIFDTADREVEAELSLRPFQTFLKSDIYLSAVQKMQISASADLRETTSSSSGSASSNSSNNYTSSRLHRGAVGAAKPAMHNFRPLPLLPEHREMKNPSVDSMTRKLARVVTISNSSICPPLTIVPTNTLRSSSSSLGSRGSNSGRGPLPATVNGANEPLPQLQSQSYNFQRAHASYLRSKAMGKHPPHPYHTDYATVVPNSAQNSELHSMSTDQDAASVDDSVDRARLPRVSRKKLEEIADWTRSSQRPSMSSRGPMNKTTGDLDKMPFIPRTHPQKVVPQKGPNPETDFAEFADVLVRKLMDCQREREIDTRMHNSLRQLDQAEGAVSDQPPKPGQGPPPPVRSSVQSSSNQVQQQQSNRIVDNRTITRQMLCEALHNVHSHQAMEEDNCSQSILDTHFAKIFDMVTCRVTYAIESEKDPYRFKIPGSTVTLRQLKQKLPLKRGTFRYYIKQADPSLGYVYEEVSDDNALLLPLGEDNVIYAKVHPDDN